MIYFDNAATTYPKPECVYTATDECLRNFGVNAGRGTYKAARQASEVIQRTRVALAELVNVRNENNVILSPSATVSDRKRLRRFSLLLLLSSRLLCR